VIDYDLHSEAFERDDWVTVWPLGASLGKQLHERSWPDFLGVVKCVEYLGDVGRFTRMRKGVNVQEELARRYLVIQQHVWNDLHVDGLIPHIRASAVPPKTEFTKFTVRAEYVVQIAADTRPPIDRDEAVALAVRDAAALPGVELQPAVDTMASGDPAVVVAARRPGPDAALAERRAVVVYPPDRGVIGRLLLHTDFQDTAADIDRVLADLLATATIIEQDPTGVEV